MKAPPTSSGSSYTPRLGVVRGSSRGPAQQLAGTQQQQQQQQAGARERHEDVEACLKGALESLSAAEKRLAELAREATQTRFELEDAQVRHATAQTKVEREGERERRVEREGEERETDRGACLVKQRRRRAVGKHHQARRTARRASALKSARVHLRACERVVIFAHVGALHSSPRSLRTPPFALFGGICS